MRPVTPSFLEALTRPHTLATRCDLLFNGQLVRTLDIVSGTVTLDRTAEIRGRCDITIDATGLIPQSAFDPVTPFGPEIQLWRGIELATGPELVSVGIFGIEEVKVAESGGTISISGLDRAQRVKDADFESTEIVVAGTNCGPAIVDLVSRGVAGLTYLFATVTAITPLLVFGDDTAGGRWAAAQSLAVSCGSDLFFDGDGRLVLVPVPDPRADPVVALTDGPEGVLVSAAKAWSRAGSYNAVTAVSTNPSGATPVRATVRDVDPTSPTYYYGPFGKKPLRYASPLITSADQATQAAWGQLRQVFGVAQSYDLTLVPNPALEPGDIIYVHRDTVGINEVSVVDSVTVGFGASDTQSAGVRSRQIAQ